MSRDKKPKIASKEKMLKIITKAFSLNFDIIPKTSVQLHAVDMNV